jgi:hypothetical protein
VAEELRPKGVWSVIKQIASCPYCRRGEVAFDYDTLELVMNPDGAQQQPCEHLVCINSFCCRNELLPDGERQVGFARLDWQSPALAGVKPAELRRRLESGAAAGGPGQPAGELPCRITPVQLEVERHLSQAETVSWLDQVGWEKAQQEMPFEECQLEGWVGFARRPAELLGSSG